MNHKDNGFSEQASPKRWQPQDRVFMNSPEIPRKAKGEVLANALQNYVRDSNKVLSEYNDYLRTVVAVLETAKEEGERRRRTPPKATSRESSGPAPSIFRLVVLLLSIAASAMIGYLIARVLWDL